MDDSVQKHSGRGARTAVAMGLGIAAVGGAVVWSNSASSRAEESASTQRVEFDLTDEQREWMACGATLFVDKDEEGARDSPLEAVRSDLSWATQAQERGAEETDPIPRRMKIALLEGAAEELSGEGLKQEGSSLEVGVPGIGSLLIEPSFEMRYTVTQLNFVPQWPDRCEEIEGEVDR